MTRVLPLLLLLSCGQSRVNECDIDTPCEFGQTCIEGQCESAVCATSAQCRMEEHCKNQRCTPGCADDSDCLTGDVCEEQFGTCKAERCESTEVDCSYREFCDTTTGQCYDAGEQYCKPCDRDDQCGEGNECWNHHCGVDCSTNPCPAGFECIDFTDDFGNVTAQQCLTYCWLFQDFPNESAR